jgi:DNA topoisomerase-3
MKLWICEKPDQARNIAAEIGVVGKSREHIETKDGIFTWGFGHLLEAVEPQDYDAKFARWVFEDLPCLPAEFRYRARDRAGSQLKAICSLLKQAHEVIVATDPDREGEMIGREILAHCKYRGPVRRLWLNALDPGSIRKALGALKAGQATEPLYFAAKARSEADWLVGMNFTRAATLTTARVKGASVVSIGRVQTPTLALIVRRDRAITNFKAVDYYELLGLLEAGASLLKLRHAPSDDKRCLDLQTAKEWADAARGGSPSQLARTNEAKHQAPPALFSLSTLQKRANALWGWSADKTLAIAQALYETHKATSYPRTDCPYLPEDQITDVPRITGHLVALRPFAHLAGSDFNARRGSVFNTAKITAHHAIIPTSIAPPLEAMKADERDAYFLIASHYLASLLPDYHYDSLRYSTVLAGREFAVTGTTPTFAGWKSAMTWLASAKTEDSGEESDEPRMPDLPAGTPLTVSSVEIQAKKTKPPAHYTEGTLVEDMENVAKHVTDPAKRARLKETSGIGTQATRAAIIETLKARKFIESKGKKILATADGRALIERLERIAPTLVDPGETAAWEERLEEIAAGKSDPARFVQEVGTNVRSLLGAFRSSAAPSSLINGASPLPEGKSTGVAGVTDRGDWFEHASVRGRLYKVQWGHAFTAEEIGRLVAGETLIVKDCRSKSGSPLTPKKVKFDAKAKPWPALVFSDVEPAAGGGGGMPPPAVTVAANSGSAPKRRLF